MRKILIIILFIPSLCLNGQSILRTNSFYRPSQTETTSSLLTGLVSYWTLDEPSGTLYDSENDNDGTATGATQNATGKIGKAVSFDNGAYEYITVSHNANLNISPRLSIAAWIYPTEDAQLCIIAKQWDGANIMPFTFFINADQTVCLQTYDSGYQTAIASGDHKTATLNQWSHVVVTVDVSGSGETKFYVNGDYDSTLTGITTLPSNSEDVLIGLYSGGYHYTGTIDEVGIWSKVLSADEVTELYNTGDGLTYPFE